MKSKSDLVKKKLLDIFKVIGNSNLSEFLHELEDDKLFLDSMNSMIKINDIFIKLVDDKTSIEDTKKEYSIDEKYDMLIQEVNYNMKKIIFSSKEKESKSEK